LIRVPESHFKAKVRSILVPIVKAVQALQAYPVKVKPHKPVQNVLPQEQQVKVHTLKNHQKALVFATVRAPLLVALDVASNEKGIKEIL